MFDYRILPEHRLIVICNWGETSLEEIIKRSQEMQADPDYSATFDVISDNTHLESQLTSEEIRRLSEHQPEAKLFPGKVAIIAPADVTFGLSRMYQMLRCYDGPKEIRVFRDTNSALAWLEKTDIDVERISKEISGEIK
jgi:hypothetical protein